MVIAARSIQLVLVSAPDQKSGRSLARAILQARLAACVNLVPGLESHYWWQAKLERSQEVLLMIKTTRSHLSGLEKLIVRKHPYDTPEVIALTLAAGNRRYLKWVKANLV
jgi:periplasmic divalent cation tolerance protein